MSEPPKRPPSAHPDVQGGCPETVWDGPYRMRCGLGGNGDVCAVHGAFAAPTPDRRGAVEITGRRITIDTRAMDHVTIEVTEDGGITVWGSDGDSLDRAVFSETGRPAGVDRACPHCPGAPLIPTAQYVEHVYRLHPDRLQPGMMP